MKSRRIRALLEEPDEFGGRDEAQRKLHELRQERDDWRARCDRAVLAQDAAWKERDKAQRNYAVAETRLAEYEREQAVAERDEARDEASISYAIIENLRAKLTEYEAVVSALRVHLRCELSEVESIEAEALLIHALRALDSSSAEVSP